MLVRRIAVLLGVLCVGVLFSSGTAFAGSGYGLSSQFGAAGAGNGQFSAPAGIAVDQTTGNVYVVDAGNARVQLFSAAGVYLSQFDGSASPAGSLSSPNGIAVDNSTNPLDVSEGDVYVVDVGHNVVDKFSSTGVYAGQITGTSGGAFAGTPLDGVGVDGNGNVWVYQASGEVDEYANDLTNTFISAHNPGFGASPGFAVDPAGSTLYTVTGCGCVERFNGSLEDRGFLDGGFASAVAIDSLSGNVYVNDVNHVAAYDPFGNPIAPVFGGGTLTGGSGIAFNDSNAMVYTTDATTNTVSVFALVTLPDASTSTASAVTNNQGMLNGVVNPQGVEVTSCQFQYGTDETYGQTLPCEPGSIGTGTEEVPVHAHASGLSPNTVYHYRLQVTNTNGTVQGADQIITTLDKPTVGGVSVSGAGTTTAKLSATVNPIGATTTYHFEYGTTTGYGTNAPVSSATIGSDTSNHPVSQQLTGLQPDTTYHYRIVAANVYGTTTGPDTTFKTFATENTTADTCANKTVREQQGSTFLPECRAYEMVSPIEKNGANVMANLVRTRTADDGNAVQYTSTGAFADAHGTGVAVEYIAQRNTEGWATHAITPPQTPYTQEISPPSNSEKLLGEMSGDLSTGVMYAFRPLTNAPNVAQVPNIYLRKDFLTPGLGNYQLLSNSGEPLAPFRENEESMVLDGESEDFNHVIFESTNSLTSDAPENGQAKLYEAEGETVRLVGILPNGEPATMSHGGRSGWPGYSGRYTVNMISRDGSQVFFNDGVGGPGAQGIGNIYMRVNHTSTVQLNVPENGETKSLPPAELWTATPDGLHVFFTSIQPLTADAGSGIGLTRLYRYDVDAPAGHHLTFISKDAEPSDGTSAVEEVWGVSRDGNYVYFTTNENRLISGQPELPYHQSIDGQGTDLYVWHNGSIHFVGVTHAFETSLTNESTSEWAKYGKFGTPIRVTADGELVYTTTTPQTPYDTTCEGVVHCGEVYVYDPAVGSPVCASCDPSGAAPTGPASSVYQFHSVPATGINSHLAHLVTTDGSKVVFDSPDALVPRDTNGKYDVYEYDIPRRELHLISSGKGGDGAYFTEMSPDGSDVFFVTSESLLSRDIDKQADLYDARVGGGIASQDGTPLVSCVGDACQGAVSVPAGVQVPASLSFSGPANIAAPVASVGSKAKAKKKAKAKAKRKAGARKRANAKKKKKGKHRRAGRARRSSHMSRSAGR